MLKATDESAVDLEAGAAAAPARAQDHEVRVLIFTACYYVLDGVTLTIRRLEAHMRTRGTTYRIVSTVPDDISDEDRGRIIVVPGVKIPFTHAGTGYAFGASLDESTIKEIERFNPTVVHFTVPDLVSLDGVRWCKRNNVPFMCTWHSNYADYLRYYFLEWALRPVLHRYLRDFYSEFDVCYVPTPYMREKLVREGFGAKCELRLWGRGCDLDLFTPARRNMSFRRARGVKDHEVLVLWVSRMVPEKRPEIWVQALQRLKDDGVPHKGLVVGSGAYESVMSSMDNVTSTGWLSGEDLAEAYASADILLFPSAVETFGNVTLEALASGVPCVVEEQCSGHLVQHGVNGFLCPAGDAGRFYELTKALALDHELRRRMSVAARESAWAWERNVILQQMIEHYKTAMVRQMDPEFLARRAAAERTNYFAMLCCDFVFCRRFAEPVLSGAGSIQNVVYAVLDFFSTQQYYSCLSLCGRIRSSRGAPQERELEKKGTAGGVGANQRGAAAMRAARIVATCLSWLLVALFLALSVRLL